MGRRSELARLRGGLGRDPIVAVEGRVGTGKTALALELGGELLQQGRTVLWIQVRSGWSTEWVLMTLSEHWELTFPPRLPTAPRVLQLASALRQREAYLFLDDFHHLSDKEVLLESFKTYLREVSLVLTSRTMIEDSVLGRADCAIVQLDGLESCKNRELLSQLLRQHGLTEWLRPEPFQELETKSLGSPTLGKLLVSLLIQGRLTSLTELQAATEKVYRLFLVELEQCLESSEDEILKRLAVYRLPVPRSALKQGAESDRGLEGLRRKLLVEALPGGRYAVHDIFRDYFEAKLGADEKARFHSLWAAYYSSVEGCPESAKEAIFHHLGVNSLHVSASCHDTGDMSTVPSRILDISDSVHHVGSVEIVDVAVTVIVFTVSRDLIWVGPKAGR